MSYQDRALQWVKLGEMSKDMKIRVLPSTQPIHSVFFAGDTHYSYASSIQCQGRMRRMHRTGSAPVVHMLTGRHMGKTTVQASVDLHLMRSLLKKYTIMDEFAGLPDWFLGEPLPCQEDQSAYDVAARVPPISTNRMHLSAMQLLEGWMTRKERKGKPRGVRKWSWQERVMGIAR